MMTAVAHWRKMVPSSSIERRKAYLFLLLIFLFLLPLLYVYVFSDFFLSDLIQF